MTTGDGPRTEAGRRILAQFRSKRARSVKDYPVHWLDAHDILAIEREAAAAPPEPPRPEGATAAEWHRYLHNEGILVADDGITPDACGPWHHRVFLDGPVAAPEGLSLDVERLAEAMNEWKYGPPGNPGPAAIEEAQRVADIYERLEPPRPDPITGELLYRVPADERASSGESGSPGEDR